MRIKYLKENGVYPKTIDELDVPIEDAIIYQEFMKRGVDRTKDHRERAVETLLDLKVSFSSAFDILAVLVKKIFNPICPYCSGPMDVVGSGGNSCEYHFDFRCTNNQCKATVAVSLGDKAIEIKPPSINK